MKNKIIFVLVFLAIASAGVASMIFLTKKGSSIILTAGQEPKLETESPSVTESSSSEPQQEVFASKILDTDYFSIILPPGWEENSEEDTLPIIIIDSKEQILNEKAKEIGFQTNFSVNKAELGEVLFKDYVENVKAGLIQSIPIIEVVKEEDTSITGKDAYLMEIKSIQQDLKFNTFVVLVAGKDNIVWAFSFNALDENWQNYKDIFNEIIKSIEMK